MRCFAVAGTGLLSIALFSGAASAADLPAPTYPTTPPLVTYTWTGCHAGAHVGGVISEDTATGLSGIPGHFSSVGFVGGGQIGCDYQFAPGWVAGIEGRAAWSSLKNTHAASVVNSTGVRIPSQFTFSNDFLASATARVGYSFADRWLVFVSGGAAWTEERIDDAFTTLAGIAVDPSATTIRTGWTGGAGLEYAFSNNWSARLEYDYYDFGSHGAKLTSNNASVTVNSLTDTIHELALGLNYRF